MYYQVRVHVNTHVVPVVLHNIIFFQKKIKKKLHYFKKNQNIMIYMFNVHMYKRSLTTDK
jgi:hypothetical protein